MGVSKKRGGGGRLPGAVGGLDHLTDGDVNCGVLCDGGDEIIPLGSPQNAIRDCGLLLQEKSRIDE